MELATPADAWYVWVGVAIVSVGAAGVVLGLPSEPPPDADEVANAADRVATSEYGARTSVAVEADEVRIGTRQVGLRNDGGTDHASVGFGSLTPIVAVDSETYDAAVALLDGHPPDDVVESDAGIESERDLRDALAAARATVDDEGAAWQETTGRIRVRSLQLAGEWVVLIDA